MKIISILLILCRNLFKTNIMKLINQLIRDNLIKFTFAFENELIYDPFDAFMDAWCESCQHEILFIQNLKLKKLNYLTPYFVMFFFIILFLT